AGIAVAVDINRPEAKVGFMIPTQVLVNAWSVLREQAIASCPYRGLFAFQEEDAKFFFGREAFTAKLVASVEKQRLVAVIGSSGSGKSSVVFAGLIPQLRTQQSWIIDSFRPGDRPLYNLAAKLLPLLSSLSATDRLDEIDKLTTKLRQDKSRLRNVVEDILKNKIGTRLLLVADQFEELFTLCQDEEERSCFIDQILTAVKHIPNFTLVLTLRADFLEYALLNRSLADALEGELPLPNSTLRNTGGAICLLGPMKRQELQDAIEKPALGLVQLEEGLSDRILDAVEKQPGNLPLLEFALTQLWAKQHNHQLTHQAYDAIRGVEKALAVYAEEKYNEFSEADKERAKRVFIQLVRPGEGTEDTRRLATRAEVGEDNWDLVTHLANQRLVVTGRNETSGEEIVEVVHEALIREWQQLRQWMDEDRSFRTWQERLRFAWRQWESSGKDEGALLRGVPLAQAEDWQHKRLEELSLEEQVFIKLSLALQDREKKRRRNITLGLICGLLITTVLAIFTALRWQLAETQIQQIKTRNDQNELAKKLDNFRLIPKTQDFVIKHIFATDDAVWMALYNSEDDGKGLMRHNLKNGSMQSYFNNKSITALLVEKKDIWVGVSEKGTKKLLHGNFQDGNWQFDLEGVRVPYSVSSLVRDQKNRLWVGTYNGVCLLKLQQCEFVKNMQSQCLKPKDPTSELQVHKMLFDNKRGVLWIATNQGLVRWHPEKKELSSCFWDKKNQQIQESPSSNFLKTLDLDKNGYLWVGTINGSVKYFAKGLDTPELEDDVWDTYNVVDNEVTALVTLPNGFVIASTLDGLFLYSYATKNWIKFTSYSNVVYYIFARLDDQLFIGTKKGLYRSE
nr:hypothetical protein [Nostoc sp. B(2019)]